MTDADRGFVERFERIDHAEAEAWVWKDDDGCPCGGDCCPPWPPPGEPPYVWPHPIEGEKP